MEAPMIFRVIREIIGIIEKYRTNSDDSLKFLEVWKDLPTILSLSLKNPP